MTDQHARATLFRSLHHADRPLILVNAWDAASARIIEDAGAPAIATTSAGAAWSLGVADGGALRRDLAVDLVARICATVTVPVTADIEAGYGTTPGEVATTVSAVLSAGAVGVNIEDAGHDGSGGLRAIEDQCARLAAARSAAQEAGVPMYLNARIDTFLSGAGGVDESVNRAEAYLAAGADGVLVPGVTDPRAVEALVTGIAAPLNIMAGPGAPSVSELAQLGVSRVSLGASVATAAYAVARRAAEETFGAGTYEAVAEGLDYGSVNALFRR